MSERFEFIAARCCPVKLVGPGTELGYDEVDGRHHALVIGNSCSSALAVEGTRRELRAFVDLLAACLSQEGEADGVGAADPPAGSTAAAPGRRRPADPGTGRRGARGKYHDPYMVI